MVKLKKSKLAKGRKGKAMKIVVLFPYNYNSPNFEQVFWGEPRKRLLGRGFTAVITAIRIEADYLLIGSAPIIVDGKETRGDMILRIAQVVVAIMSIITSTVAVINIASK